MAPPADANRDSTTDALHRLLEPVVAAAGLDLEAVELSAAGKRRVLRLAVDQDGGVGLDDVAEVTRQVSAVLDAPEGEAVMGGTPYTLEVGSPGVGRPLTLPRHWRRNADRLVEVSLADGSSVTGRVTGSDDDGADLDVDGTVRRVGFDEVRKALVQVEFNRKERT